MTAVSTVAHRVAARWQALAWWVQVLSVYLAARAVSAVLTDRVGRFQAANFWTPSAPGYLDFVGIWDGDWYRRIAEAGYPLPVPVDSAGTPLQSEWAFYPGYPAVVRVVSDLTGASWEVAAPTTSLALGAAAALVVNRLFADRAGRGTALAGVALVAVYPASPVLQYAYSEGMALLALAAALLLLQRRRYLAAALPVAVLGLTRPVALPLALVVGVHLVSRWRSRAHDPLPGTELARLVALLVAAAAAGVAWPLVVGALTGDLGTYTQVQSAWRGGGRVQWLVPWWSMSRYLLGAWLGPLALTALVVGFGVLLASRSARVLGRDMTTWCAAYAGYLLLVVEPFTPIFRFVILLFPLALVVATSARSRGHLVTWVGVFLVAQLVWVVWLWRFLPPSDVPP